MADLTGDTTCIASSSSSPTNTNHVYDIFLNHRGPDEKKRLASHIYRGLIVRRLRVFLDQPELRKGEDMPSQIEEAIRTASVHVAIFSPTYARSRWCLDELALMVESGSTIIPVFHNVDPSEIVDPSELRWTRSGDGVLAGVQSILGCISPCLLGEKGRYARDLQWLENKTTLDLRTNKKKPRYDSSTLKKWRDALYLVSNKSGFDMNAYDGDEGQLVDEVVKEVWRKVSKTPLHVAEYATGLNEKIEYVERMVQQQSQKMRVVGIVGLGGVGKTTLAKESFNRHRSNYDRYCFLSDVRETAAKSSLSSLQPRLLKDLAHLQDEQIRNIDEGKEKLRKHISSCPPSLLVLDDSVGQLTGLQVLYLKGCSSLQGLPDSVGQLTGLEKISFNGCFSLQTLPDSLGAADGPPDTRVGRLHQPPGAPRLDGAADRPPGTLLEPVHQPAGAPRLSGAVDGPPGTLLEPVLQPASPPRLSGAGDGPPEPQLGTLNQPAGAPRLGGAADGPLELVLQPASTSRLGGAVDGPREIYLNGCSNLQALPDSAGQLTGL